MKPRKPLKRSTKPLKRTAIARSTKPLKRIPLKPAAPPKRKRIKQRITPKQQASRDQLDALRPALAERSGGACEVRFSPDCTGQGIEPHHVVKQSHIDEHRLDLILMSCRQCNDRVETHPAEARAAGVSLRSWEIPPRP